MRHYTAVDIDNRKVYVSKQTLRKMLNYWQLYQKNIYEIGEDLPFYIAFINALKQLSKKDITLLYQLYYNVEYVPIEKTGIYSISDKYKPNKSKTLEQKRQELGISDDDYKLVIDELYEQFINELTK